MLPHFTDPLDGIGAVAVVFGIATVLGGMPIGLLIWMAGMAILYRRELF